MGISEYDQTYTTLNGHKYGNGFTDEIMHTSILVFTEVDLLE